MRKLVGPQLLAPEPIASLTPPNLCEFCESFDCACTSVGLQLLAPEGGVIIAPIDSELRRVSRDASGVVRSHIVSQVRFTELEVST